MAILPSSLRLVAGAIKQVAADIVTVRTGTVVSDYAPMSQTLVTLDNDPDQATVQAEALWQPLPAQARVKMIAFPPRGLFIVGTMTQLPSTVDSGWIAVGSGGSAPAFQNSWANFGGGWTPARYRKIGSQVFIEGMITAGSAATATMFTLPAGYRPTAGQVMYAAIAAQRLTNSNTGTGTDFTDGSNQPDVGAQVGGAPAHTHGGGHQHSGIWDTFNTGTRLDVDTAGNVFQAGGDSSSFVALWGSFFID